MKNSSGKGALGTVITIIVLILIVYFIWYGFFRTPAEEVVLPEGEDIMMEEEETTPVVEVEGGVDVVPQGETATE